MALAAALILSSLAAPTVGAQSFAILYYEELRAWSFDAAAAGRAAKPETGRPDLSFDAFGRRFDIVLEPNARLLRTAPALGFTRDDLELYTGRLVDNADSWVRLSRTHGRLSGMIWDGAELYGLDDFSRIAASAVRRDATASARTVIYRWSDTVGTLADALSYRPKTDDTATVASSKAATAPDAPLAVQKGISPGRILDIAAIGDAEFATRHGADAAIEMLGIMNIVDGIFIGQVGVQLNVTELTVFDSASEPFTSQDPSALLAEVEAYKDSTPELRAAGLMHLFTGRDLDDLSADGTQTVGIANMGVLCSPRYGAGLSQTTFGSTFDALIVAHELGHNFGAPHDGETGSVCETAEPNRIMATQIGGNLEFSTCSVDQMMPELSSSTCLRELAPVDMTLSVVEPPPPVVEDGGTFTVRLQIVNETAIEAVGVELLLDAPNFGNPTVRVPAGVEPPTCYIESPSRCVWPYFPANGDVEVELTFAVHIPSAGSIDIDVTSLSETDTTNGSAHFDVDVSPIVELRAELDPAALELHPGASETVELALTNGGDTTATDVVAYLAVRNAVEITAFGLEGCVRSGSVDPVEYECPIGELAPGEVVTAQIRVQSPLGLTPEQYAAGGWLGARVDSREPDWSVPDNEDWTRITTGESIADLAVTLTGPAGLQTGQAFVFVAEVSNLGPDTARDIVVSHYPIGVPVAAGLTGISTTHGACVMTPPDNDFECATSQLPVGETMRISLTGAWPDPGDVALGVIARMASSDSNSTNDLATRFLTVSEATAGSDPGPAPEPTPAPEPGPPSTEAGPDSGPGPAPVVPPSSPTADAGGGGGGVLDWLALLGLLGGTVLRHARRVPECHMTSAASGDPLRR